MAPAAEVVHGSSSTAQPLLDAQLELWHHTLSYIKSMALKAALDLCIADAIQHHGGTATLFQIATQANLHPSKVPCLRRLMRVLGVTGVFSFSSVEEHFGVLFNQGMLADSSFVMDSVVNECGDVFRGLTSLTDVAGGLGGAAQAIAKAFPDVKCSVLDLPHVVANAPIDTGTVKYIAGDMFESVPPANAIFLKWVLHDWGDPECVKILKNCKKAIPSRHAGGKVIILDMVVGAGSSNVKHKETQVLFDLMIMVVNGTERDEQEWRKVIFEAGFSDYKIIPVLGVRSIIEVYP